MIALSTEDENRLWSLVDASGDCWLYSGGQDGKGYGFFRTSRISGRRQFRVHRLVYEWLVGPIPESLELDHLCRVRNCVNPDHLEIVTHKENTRRGWLQWKLLLARTHCANGHEWTPKSTYYYAHGGRACRICVAAHARRYRTMA